jgi:hypothetical protein
VRLVEAGRTGVYNADEPARTLTMGQFPATCKAVGGGEACFARADDRFLLDAWGGAWLEPPL